MEFSRTVDLHERSRPTSRLIATNSRSQACNLIKTCIKSSFMHSSYSKMAFLTISTQYYYLKVRWAPDVASFSSLWMKPSILLCWIGDSASPIQNCLLIYIDNEAKLNGALLVASLCYSINVLGQEARGSRHLAEGASQNDLCHQKRGHPRK